MSRLEKPLTKDILWATGDVLLRAELVLFLKDDAGNWQPQPFRADPGSEISTMPAFRAKILGLPMPQKGVVITMNTAAGRARVVVRSGYLRFQVDGMGPTEYVAPCLFAGDPNPLPSPGVPPAPHNLLGLSGVVDKLRLTFDGKPSLPAAPYGLLIVEQI